MPKPRVLVVDDEENLADLVAMALRYDGMLTEVAGTVRHAKMQLASFAPDLIVLDISLPDGSGVDLCRSLRAASTDTPIVFLTARDGVDDRIRGLTAGGDDYVTKPFSLDELVVRVRTVLRRTNRGGEQGRVQVADLEIDVDAHVVRRAGRVIDLTPTEFTLLRFLASNAGRVLSKRQILDHVWQYDFAGRDGIVQTYISYLRKKVDEHGPRLIHTIPRIGYVLRPPYDAGEQ